MIAVILCGGSGSRLWPLSRKILPKQFIEFPGGSLLCRTLKRVSAMDIEHCVLICNEDHHFFVLDAVNKTGLQDKTSILLEPIVKDTAPAIALASFHILEKFGNRPMLVLPSDHIIENPVEFKHQVSAALPVAATGALVTFGITPDIPHTGYGYIQRGEAVGEGAFRVKSFQEKPDFETARERVASGDCYWNSGMFLFEAQVYLDSLTNLEPEIFAACERAYANYVEDLGFIRVDKTAFAASPAISIDYAIMEKSVANSVVMPVDISWNDVGSWESLGELLEPDEQGNRVTGDTILKNSSDNIVYSSKRLVSLLGIKNCAVIETSDAVLVADKSNLQEIKLLVDDLVRKGRDEAMHNLRTFRPWGYYERVDADNLFQVKRIMVNPGQSLSLQEHQHRAEHWVVVEGRARVTVGEKTSLLEANESVYIPKQTKHRLENCEEQPLFLIEVQCGEYLGEDDIIRYEDIYGRVTQDSDEPA